MLQRRRFWQIHLSTAVILMVVAAILIAVNAEIDRENVHPNLKLKDGWPWKSAVLDVLNIGLILLLLGIAIEGIQRWRANRE
jgi:hypothetical protein